MFFILIIFFESKLIISLWYIYVCECVRVCMYVCFIKLYLNREKLINLKFSENYGLLVYYRICTCWNYDICYLVKLFGLHWIWALNLLMFFWTLPMGVIHWWSRSCQWRLYISTLIIIELIVYILILSHGISVVIIED